VLGVELDEGTARIARLNTIRWRERCNILTGAVNTHDAPIVYGIANGEEYGAKIGGNGIKKQSNGYTIQQLISLLWVDTVDFIKMDIEGAESDVLLTNNNWLECVKLIQVELHGYNADDFSRVLIEKGFSTYPVDSHWNSILAINSRFAAV